MACTFGPSQTLADEHPLCVEYGEDEWVFCDVRCGAGVSSLGTRAYVHDVQVDPPVLCAVRRLEREALRLERAEGDGGGVGGQAVDGGGGGSLGKRLRKANDALALSSVFTMPPVAIAMDVWPRMDVARSFRYADQSNLGNVGAPEIVAASLADHDEPGKELVLSPPRRMGGYSAVLVQIVESVLAAQHLVSAGIARPEAPAGVAPAPLGPVAPVAPAGGAGRAGRGRGGGNGAGAARGGRAGRAVVGPNAQLLRDRHAEGSVGLWEIASTPATVARWSKGEAMEATRGLLTISKALRMLSMRNKKAWEKLKDSTLTVSHPRCGDIHWFAGLWSGTMDMLRTWAFGVITGTVVVDLRKWATTAPTNALIMIGIGLTNEGARAGEIGTVTRPVWAAIKAAEATTAVAIEEVGGAPGVPKRTKKEAGAPDTPQGGRGGRGRLDGGGSPGGPGRGGSPKGKGGAAAAAAATAAAAAVVREPDATKLIALRAAILGRNDVDSITRAEVIQAHLCFSCKWQFHGRSPCDRRGQDMPPPGRN